MRELLRLIQIGSDTLYNLANLIKEDDQQRADHLYFKSLNLNNWASQCWHNYGSNLTDLHRQENAIQALKISISLDPFIADVWCNLGLAYYGLDRFDEASVVFDLVCQWYLRMLRVI